jgi:hypothetical protein
VKDAVQPRAEVTGHQPAPRAESHHQALELALARFEQVTHEAERPIGTEDVVQAGARQLAAFPADEGLERRAVAVVDGQDDGPGFAVELMLEPAPILGPLGVGGADGVQIRLGAGRTELDHIAVVRRLDGPGKVAHRIDQVGEAQGLQPRRGQRLGRIQAHARLGDQGVIVGKGRADGTGESRRAAVMGQEAHGAASPPEYGDIGVGPAAGDRLGEIRAEQGAAPQGRGGAKGLPGLPVGGAQVGRADALRRNHGVWGQAMELDEPSRFRLGNSC